MSDPHIAVCAAREHIHFKRWEFEASLLPHTYIGAVERAGGLALIIPPDERTVDEPDRVLDLVDGLLLAGGSDMDATSYDAAPHPETDATSSARDRAEIALARRAMERELPILGICRGMQVLNVACGGTLNQHLANSRDHMGAEQPFVEHEVKLAAGSVAQRWIKNDQLTVWSEHHQGIDQLGRGLNASGWSVPDGLVEAIEPAGSDSVLGVLWHTERDAEAELIQSFVEQARA